MNGIKVPMEYVPGIMDVDRLKACIKNNYNIATSQKEDGIYYAVLLSENGKPEECVATILFDFEDGAVFSYHSGIDEKGHRYNGKLYHFDAYGSEWSCEELVHPWHRGFIRYAFLDQGREEIVELVIGHYGISEICEHIGITWREYRSKLREIKDKQERIKFIENNFMRPWKAWLALNDTKELDYITKKESDSLND